MACPSKRPRHAFRICDSRFPVFDGGGAAKWGARWNSPGRRVIYASETYSGALLEQLVHAGIREIPANQVVVRISIPRSVTVEIVKAQDVPGWEQEDLIASRAYGDAWYDSRRACVLVVPSVVARLERNILFNQTHSQFEKLKIGPVEPVVWDVRLFRRRNGRAQS